MVKGNLEKRPPNVFSVQRTVEFYETDMAGIVHYSNAFRFVEFAERQFFEQGGFCIYDPGSDHRWPIVGTECNYIAPMSFNDVLKINLWVNRIGKSSLTLGFAIEIMKEKSCDDLCAHGSLTVIYAVNNQKTDNICVREIPPNFKAYFSNYCNR